MAKFVKGQTGNPAGRPQGVRAALRKRWGNNGERLLDMLGEVAEGRMEVIQERVLASGDIVELRVRPTISERKDALIELLAHLAGRPVALNFNANVDLPPEALPMPELQSRVADVLAKFAAPALPRENQVIDVTPTLVKPPENG